jgi:tRNA A-37 threonylcarbamoyl transferase component Bud32
MLKIIQTAALSLSVLLGSFATLPVAQAASVSVTLAPETVQYRHERDWRHERHRDRPRRACTPERAMEKAWKMGINRPRVANVNRNTIAVRGFQRGHTVRVLFARAPNCPVIR